MTLLYPLPHIVIGGLGLIGGSLAGCFSQQGLKVTGVDRSTDTIEKAIANTFINAGFKDLQSAIANAADSAETVWVFLCGPLSVNLVWLQQIAAGLPPHVFVTDVGSCKRRIVAAGQALLPDQFVGGHPMAGKAVGGLDHAVTMLFHQRPYVLCPHPLLPQPVFERLEQLITLTSSQLHRMNADTHDRMVAWVSHVPQLYSYALAQGLQAAWPDIPLIHGPALTEHLRLSTSPPAIWADIFEENRDNIEIAWQQLHGETGQYLNNINLSFKHQ